MDALDHDVDVQYAPLGFRLKLSAIVLFLRAFESSELVSICQSLHDKINLSFSRDIPIGVF